MTSRGTDGLDDQRKLAEGADARLLIIGLGGRIHSMCSTSEATLFRSGKP